MLIPTFHISLFTLSQFNFNSELVYLNYTHIMNFSTYTYLDTILQLTYFIVGEVRKPISYTWSLVTSHKSLDKQKICYVNYQQKRQVQFMIGSLAQSFLIQTNVPTNLRKNVPNCILINCNKIILFLIKKQLITLKFFFIINYY